MGEQVTWTMVMADDRNLTSHTYNESLADEIALRLHKHYEVLTHWLDVIDSKVVSL